MVAVVSDTAVFVRRLVSVGAMVLLLAAIGAGVVLADAEAADRPFPPALSGQP